MSKPAATSATVSNPEVRLDTVEIKRIAIEALSERATGITAVMQRVHLSNIEAVKTPADLQIFREGLEADLRRIGKLLNKIVAICDAD